MLNPAMWLLQLVALLATSMAGAPIDLPPSESFNGHTADIETVTLCNVMWPGWAADDCQRVALCESGSDHQAVGVNGDGINDYGRWQHNGRYHTQRLAAIGMPDGDVLDLTTNAMMSRWLWGVRGGSFTGSSGWACGAKVGAV